MVAGVMAPGADSVLAQGVSTPVPAGQTTRTIEVGGEGRVSVTPDAASVVVGAEIFNATLTEAQAQANAITAEITAAATAAGVEEDDLQTVNYNVWVVNQYDENGTIVGVQGYTVTNQLQVIVRDLDAVGGLLDDMVQAGANAIYGISFFVSDPSEAASQARQLAVEDARTRADELASALGTEITGVVSVVETSAPSPASQDMMYEGAAGGGRGGGPVPISSGTTEVVVTVNVVFEIAG
jgi:uncharacterized protein YggE